MIPPLVFSSSSIRFTRTRSPSGLIFITGSSLPVYAAALALVATRNPKLGEPWCNWNGERDERLRLSTHNFVLGNRSSCTIANLHPRLSMIRNQWQRLLTGEIYLPVC